MAPVHNAIAAACHSLGVITPSETELEALLVRPDHPSPLRFCSGGTTSRCADDQHWTVDLSLGYRSIHLNANRNRVRIGAGLTMGEIQAELANHDCMIPTGLSGLPGAGFLLSGGMGPLSRSLGLAIDHIQSIEGIWGNGTRFSLEKPKGKIHCCENDHAGWWGLLGAGLFLAAVESFELNTTPLLPLIVQRGCLSSADLAELIQEAERFPEGLSLQWCWGIEREVMLVSRADDPESEQRLEQLSHGFKLPMALRTRLSGLHGLPAFGALAMAPWQEAPPHQEVVGVLGPRWGDATTAVIGALEKAMACRPHSRCSIASQQLGGAVARETQQQSAFLHRQAEWKPWITAAWSAGDHQGREQALAWLEQVWGILQPHCPGVHLAQLHDHLPWHQRTLEGAFGHQLPVLRKLKQQLDPCGQLPRL